MARHALLIGVSEFADKRLGRLNAPTNDVIALRRILEDDSRGGFSSVDLSLNEDFLAIRDRLGRFFQDKAPDDLLLLFYSGHGILGRGNRLFLATAGSSIDAPRERSISAADIRELMEECRAQRQIVVLDCCHSGAFAEQAKSGAPPPAVTADTFATGDAGIYVLTAADALQFAWDGDDLRTGDATAKRNSRFTGWLVDALEGGEAAPDDEQITMDGLYRYLYQRARLDGAASTPQRFVRGGVGDPVISRNPAAGIARVDADIQTALGSAADHRLRLGAVAELAHQMRGNDKAAARGARLLLTRHLQQERDFLVRQAITEALETASPPKRAEAKPPPPPEAPAVPLSPPGPSPPQSAPPADRTTTVSVGSFKFQVSAPAGGSGIAGATSAAATGAEKPSSLSEGWRALPWWMKPSLILFWPLGLVWLARYRREPLPQWMKVTVLGLWVLAVIVAIATNQSQPAIR